MRVLSNPVFYLGVVAGAFLLLFIYFAYPHIFEKTLYHVSRSHVDELIERMHRGEIIDINREFAPPKNDKEPKPARYYAWRCFAYWIADQCASYQYSPKKAADILRLGKICFGEKGVAYTKLVAVEAIINRSTKYYLNKHRNPYGNPYRIPFHEKEDADFSKLYQMVDLIVESTYPDVY